MCGVLGLQLSSYSNPEGIAEAEDKLGTNFAIGEFVLLLEKSGNFQEGPIVSAEFF